MSRCYEEFHHTYFGSTVLNKDFVEASLCCGAVSESLSEKAFSVTENFNIL